MLALAVGLGMESTKSAFHQWVRGFTGRDRVCEKPLVGVHADRGRLNMWWIHLPAELCRNKFTRICSGGIITSRLTFCKIYSAARKRNRRPLPKSTSDDIRLFESTPFEIKESQHKQCGKLRVLVIRPELDVSIIIHRIFEDFTQCRGVSLCLRLKVQKR